MYPLGSELAADGIPVAVSLRVHKLARQPYYRWLNHPVTAAQVERAYRANALHDVHQYDPEFGYRLLRDAAEAAGEPMATRTAWKAVPREPVALHVRAQEGQERAPPRPARA